MVHNCRICFEEDIREHLISPCLCSGNSKYVHSDCLENWRNVNLQNTKYYSCEICKENYIFELKNDNVDNPYKKYFIFLSLDIFICSLISLITIYCCGFLVNLITEKKINFADNKHVNYFIIGSLSFLLVIFIIGYFTAIYKNNNRFYHNNIHQKTITFNNNTLLLLLATIGLFVISFFIINYMINIRKKYYFNKYYINNLKYTVKNREKV